MSEPFRIKYGDIWSLVKLYKNNLSSFIDNAEECKKSVQALIDDESFNGATADAIKAYLSEVVLTTITSAEIIAQTMLDYIGAYLTEYGTIDSSQKFNLIQEELQDFKKDLNKDSCDTNDISDDFKTTVRSVEELINDPGAASHYELKCQNPMSEENKRIRDEIDKLIQDVTDHEKNTYKKIKADITPLIAALNKNLENIKLNYSNISLYKLGSFPASPDLVNLVNLVSAAANNHNVHQSEYEADWEEITGKLNADERKSAGVWKTIGGISLAAGGVACVVLTAGAATPAIVYLGLAAGTGSALFGTSDTIEGTADIYYGSIGDATTVTPNPLLYSSLFNGDRALYNNTEFAFGLASSVFAPVGKANPITYSEAAKLCAKEAVSMGAGNAGGDLSASIADDLGANDAEIQTARLIGGMVGGSLTSNALDGSLLRLNDVVEGSNPELIHSINETGTQKLVIDDWGDNRPSTDNYLHNKAIFDNPKYYDQSTGDIRWPGTNGDINTDGFLKGEYDDVVLTKGNVIDRYGSDNGTFFGEVGTAVEKRAMAPNSDFSKYNKYEIKKDIPMRKGFIAPWFDKPGGGIQYKVDPNFEETIRSKLFPNEKFIDGLIRLGYIKKIRS